MPNMSDARRKRIQARQRKLRNEQSRNAKAAKRKARAEKRSAARVMIPFSRQHCWWPGSDGFTTCSARLMTAPSGLQRTGRAAFSLRSKPTRQS